jgi:hypothetical protein
VTPGSPPAPEPLPPASPPAVSGHLVRRWAWAAWAALVVVVSVVPAGWLLGAAPRQAWSALAAVAHLLEFLVLMALLLWSVVGASGRSPAQQASAGAVVARAAVAAAAIALAVELLQWPLPYRSFDPLDLLADAGGIAVAAAGFAVARRRSGTRRL